MKSFPLMGDDAIPDSPLNKILSGALGKAIIFSEAPTTANAICPEGEFGYFSTKLYYAINGTTYSINLTAV